MIIKQKTHFGLNETFCLSKNGNIIYVLSIKGLILQIESIDLYTHIA